MTRFPLAFLAVVLGCECGARDDASTDASAVPLDVPDDRAHGGEDAPVPISVNDPYDPSTWVRPTPVALPMAPGSGPAPAPVWRESTMGLCAEYTGDAQAHGVQATAQGVYSHVTIVNNPLAMGAAWERPWGRAVYFNGGTGWVERAFVPGDYLSGGFVATSTGTVFLADVGCGVVRVAPGPSTFENVRCALEQPRYSRTLLSVAPDDSVFALSSFPSGVSAVYRHDGASFEKVIDLPTLPDVEHEGAITKTTYTALAAWEDGFVVGTSEGELRVYVGELLEQRRAPNGERVSSISATGPSDIWLASGFALDHYDGETFTRHTIPGTCGPGDFSLYVSGTTAYFVHARAFGRVVDGEVEVLASLACDSSTLFRGISGTSPTEVFVTMENRDFVDYACGTTFMGYFDGVVMHRL